MSAKHSNNETTHQAMAVIIKIIWQTPVYMYLKVRYCRKQVTGALWEYGMLCSVPFHSQAHRL